MVAADGDGVAEGQRGGKVSAGTPNFTVGNEVAEDLAAFYSGPGVG